MEVQTIPSGEVKIFPPLPIATNFWPTQITEFKGIVVVPWFLNVHVFPSIDVYTAPGLLIGLLSVLSPTSTSCELFQITHLKFFQELELIEVQFTASLDVIIVPVSPTATNTLPVQATDRRWACIAVKDFFQ
jgi:hypothetical protein